MSDRTAPDTSAMTTQAFADLVAASDHLLVSIAEYNACECKRTNTDCPHALAFDAACEWFNTACGLTFCAEPEAVAALVLRIHGAVPEKARL